MTNESGSNSKAFELQNQVVKNTLLERRQLRIVRSKHCVLCDNIIAEHCRSKSRSMSIKKAMKTTRNQLMARWFVCRITSGRKSAQYGIRFSYPLFISIVAFGIFFENPYILSIDALIALFGFVLPMHPFDYVYNYGVTKLIGTNRIPGRGSELQISSIVALIFILAVISLIVFEIQLNYEVMALMYVLISIFFIAVLLSKNDFSIYSFYRSRK